MSTNLNPNKQDGTIVFTMKDHFLKYCESFYDDMLAKNMTVMIPKVVGDMFYKQVKDMPDVTQFQAKICLHNEIFSQEPQSVKAMNSSVYVSFVGVKHPFLKPQFRIKR